MNNKTKKRRSPQLPSLQFSPTAWAKLLFLREYGDTEVGGFGISAADDLLLIEDIQLVRQTCSWAHVAFEDDAVAEFFDEQVDAGRKPEQFARVWIHTHPGDCPQPSGVDEETFERVFGNAEWAVMFILARGGDCYARLRFNSGPGGETELPIELDYGREFNGSDFDAWEIEYLQSVDVEEPAAVARSRAATDKPVRRRNADDRDQSHELACSVDWEDEWLSEFSFAHRSEEECDDNF
ncbi:hypothetical protein [Rubinisphaera margarita]|uniref:hypothetical protein n=1 Tax=Rubinisphaera margarita TaxID=2909586 RepID=UPI001EE7C9D0|nr:hypothetical protein [Rubinisphaera margarita]MCG6157260.1 hypothetical protein [Rubinisphaera margarita]